MVLCSTTVISWTPWASTTVTGAEGGMYVCVQVLLVSRVCLLTENIL